MMDYGALAALAAVIREGTFEKAAVALHVTPSAVSQRIKLLEERTGAALVRRGQPCQATTEGMVLCRHFEAVRLMEGELVGVLPQLSVDDGPATISIAVNADSLASWFVRAAGEYIRETGILIDFKLDDQDHTAEWLRRGEVLAAITAAEKPVPGCMVQRLGKLSYRATASPEFMARYFASGVTPETISKAPSLTFDRKDKLQSLWVEHQFGHDVPRPTHWLPSTDGFLTACLNGVGWGLNPMLLDEAHIQAGRLCELVPGTPINVPLYWQTSRRATSLLDKLTKHVLAAGRDWLA